MAFTHLCVGLLCGDYCQIDDSGVHPLYTVSHTLMLRSATHNGEWCFDHVSANTYISAVPKKSINVYEVIVVVEDNVMGVHHPPLLIFNSG